MVTGQKSKRVRCTANALLHVVRVCWDFPVFMNDVKNIIRQ